MKRVTFLAACLAALSASSAALAQSAPGVSADEIKIGQTMPYSGPVAAFSALGKGEVAYFNMINDVGGSTATIVPASPQELM